jgi:predicted GNAT superfamily acetyltransferase
MTLLSPSAGATPPLATIGDDLLLRSLDSPEDYAACVELQRLTWGKNYVGVVPATLLKLSQMLGGVNAGAFTENGLLAGFVYGLTGLREGRLIHWSHMLAVHPDLRDYGLGLRLKEFQRQALRGTGIERIYWTFDPLVARNAHFNLNRLRVRVCEYVLDMYGNTGSDLHAFGTDRFIVSWPVVRRDEGESPDREGIASAASAPIVNVVAGSTDRGVEIVHHDATTVRVEIPSDIAAVAARSLADARSWRSVTRSAFELWMGRGLRVKGFYRDDTMRCFYVLTSEGPGVGSPC